MRKRLVPLIVSVLILIMFGVIWLLSVDNNVAVMNPKGTIAYQQKNLILFTTILGLFVILPVFAMLFGFMWKYRANNTKAKYTPEDSGNRLLESIWWGIPIIIILVLSVITFITSHQLDPHKPIESNKAPLKVQVVALQWRWLFLYPDQGVASINELHIPAGRPIELSISADAPMSAFWVPNLGSQIYAMNGMTSTLHLQADEIGDYRGSNTNINGKGYASMDFTVMATSDDNFKKWVDSTSMVDRYLEWTRYEKLSQQSEDSSVQYFKLLDVDLYHKIIEKYMSHGVQDASQEADNRSKMMHMNHEGTTQ